MWSIYRKELNSFFSSLIGYMVIGVFLLVTGLVLFVFPDTSLLEYNYATLGPLFDLAPSVFLFLIPAITMRSFAEENQAGTIELLTTKPLRDLDITLGKFLASLTLVAFALLPTFIFYYTVYELGMPRGNLDSGAAMGSYLGLLLLAAVFVAIGLWVSSLTQNQIVAFILGAFFCFLVYSGFDYFSRLPIFVGRADDLVAKLGISYHYASISRGLIDSRDLVYFLSAAALFLAFTLVSLDRRRW
jgi:ABC-2 type transport system permease protein